MATFADSLRAMPLEQLKHEYQKRNDRIGGIRDEIRRLEEMEREDRDFYEEEVRMGRRGGHAGDWPSTLEINPRRVAELDMEVSELEREKSLIDNEMGKKWS